MRRGVRRAAVAVTVVALPAAVAAGALALTSQGPGTAPGSRTVAEAGQEVPAPASPTTTAPTGSATPSPLPEGQAAPGSQPLGLRWSWAQPDTFDFVARASGGWTFAEVLWCDVQPDPATWDWTAVDRVVQNARILGHETMLKLRTGQCWGTSAPSAAERDVSENAAKDPSTPATDLPAYLDFVRAVVGRYAARGIEYYAVENEPDTVNHWAAPIEAYRDTAEQVAAVVREVDPAALVVDGGVSSTAYGVVMADALIERDPSRALATYRDYYGRRLAGEASRFPDVPNVAALRAVLRTDQARRAIDAVAVAVDLANTGVTDRYQLHFYEPPDQLGPVLELLDERLDPQVQVEAWEVGVAWPGPDFDERVQATETFRTVGLLLSAGVRRIVHLPVAYSDAPGKLQVFRGLTEADGTTLPAGDGWLALSDALAGLHDARVWPASSGLTGATWRVGGRQAALVWASGEPVALDPADVAEVVDATGVTVTGAPVVGADPVLVIGSANGDLTGQVARGAR